MPQREKLRVGLLLDSFTVPAWTYRMLELVRASDYAEICLVVLNEPPVRQQGFLAKLFRARGDLLYLLYRKFDRRRCRNLKPYADRPQDAAGLLADVPVLKVTPRRTKFSDRFEQPDLETIGEHRVHVFVRLGFRILRGEILEAARYGVWSFHHGDNRVNRGGPAGFWEVFDQHATTGSILQILGEDLDNGTVLARSYGATNPASVERNRHRLLWKSLHFLPRKLEELHRLGEQAFFEQVDAENAAPNFYSNRLYVQPTNAQFVGPLVRLIVRRAVGRIRAKVRFDQWGLMFRLDDQMAMSQIATSLWRFAPIIPPKDRFWADPHIVHRDGKYYIFIEEFPYAAGKGHISLIEMDEQGQYTAPRKILEAPHHLSYPLVFQHEGEYYMLPESPGKKTTEVYRCVEFPDRWELHKTLFADLSAIDATLFHYEDRWWLFANIEAGEGCSPWDELFLFHAETPLSDHWTPHPKNPIISDVRRARPAGRIFEHKGRFYRPSQDCSDGYGYAIRINEIITLSTSDYEEREVAHVEPNFASEVRGVHHLSHEGRLTMLDVRRARWKLGR